MNIGDIFFALRGDGGPLQVDAQKAGEAAGLKAGQSFGAKLKMAAGGALGAALGTGVGMALTGANQLDAATRQLAADAGLTAEEASKAEHSLAGMYRNNLQGFDAIGAAMAKVHNDLGLTGDAADEATAKFLKFATATGQNAADAVTAFDDILDNWGMTADDVQGVMDKLIVSHQKYGGTLAANQKTLAALAPALRAANFGIDDGIELLGLFGSKGLDAEVASAAFAKALTKVKSPAELQRLITDISNTEDPFARAALAADLFGAKAGAKLANALGGANLDDYAVSMEEAAGATERAASVIEDSWGNRFQLLMKNAGGALAEFGTKFGPLLMVASAFGPQLTKAIGAGVGGLAGILIPKVVGGVAATAVPGAMAGTGVGATIGAAIGAAIPIAIAVGLGLGVALAFKKVFLDPALEKQTKEIGSAVGEQIVEGTVEQLKQSKAALERGIKDINAVPLGGFLYGDQINSLQSELDKVDAEILRRAADTGASIPVALADGLKSTMPVWDGDVATLVTTFTTSMSGVVQASRVTGADGMAAMAAGIKSARSKPLDAFETLTEMLKHAMTPSAEAARLAGQLMSKELAAGLKSKDPEVRAQALAVKDMILDRLKELAEAGNIGKNTMAELAKGLKSKDPEIRAAAEAVKAAVEGRLRAIEAKEAGAAAAVEFATEFKARLVASLADLREGAWWSSEKFSTALPPRTPGGGAAVRTFAMGTPFVERDQLAFVHRGEAVIPAAQNRLGAVDSSLTINLTVQGDLRAETKEDVVRTLQRAAAFAR